MSSVAIRADNLSKRYNVSSTRRHNTLRDQVSQSLRDVFRRRVDNRGDLWALKDVSFEVKPGEVMGIIGRNGAGKTTLLRILSRITNPTTGRAEIFGRVGSMLEVGTGFHPELSGRENVYLSGAILGMKKREIDRAFDDIVAFAELDKFVDTPVKHYSSGMQVRLAFAVAAQLRAEILLIDEVLAVGDVGFQRKCLGKMNSVVNEGRTILFVSHNMAAMRALCHSGIVLEQGEIKYSGEIRSAVESYLRADGAAEGAHYALELNHALPVQLLSISVVDSNGKVIDHHSQDQPLWIRIEVVVRQKTANIYLIAQVHDSSLDAMIFTRDFDGDEDRLLDRLPGVYTYGIRIPGSLLIPGQYRVSAQVVRAVAWEIMHRADYVCPFQLVDGGSIRGKVGFPWRGKIGLPFEWECIHAAPSSS